MRQLYIFSEFPTKPGKVNRKEEKIIFKKNRKNKSNAHKTVDLSFLGFFSEFCNKSKTGSVATDV